MIFELLNVWWLKNQFVLKILHVDLSREREGERERLRERELVLITYVGGFLKNCVLSVLKDKLQHVKLENILICF